MHHASPSESLNRASPSERPLQERSIKALLRHASPSESLNRALQERPLHHASPFLQSLNRAFTEGDLLCSG